MLVQATNCTRIACLSGLHEYKWGALQVLVNPVKLYTPFVPIEMKPRLVEGPERPTELRH